MIRYTLACDKGHSFESWFQSANSFDDLAVRGLLNCAVCGTTAVTKSLMAPLVRTNPATPPKTTPPKKEPAATIESKLAGLRRQIEENSDYVGLSFAAEARAMHEGLTPERSIYGEARPEEARALLEDGIPVTPLPFIPKRHTN